ncbi:hypothetical protein C0J52_23778 [Blattella germanica]|nr:hypothetical protein C0J52_23778 [Blattella germanica]
MYEQEEARICDLLQSVLEDEVGSESLELEDNLEESDHDTDSEQSGNDIEDNQNIVEDNSCLFFLGEGTYQNT